MIEQRISTICPYLQYQVSLSESQRINSQAETELCLMDANLRESEELYQLILKNVSDTVLITDDTGTLTFICPNTEVTLGYSYTEIQQFGTIQELFGEDWIEQTELETVNEHCNIERTFIDKIGKHRVLLINVKRVKIQAGTRLYSCRDITDQKITQEALYQAQKELERREEEKMAQISESNALVRAELIERKRAETALYQSEARNRALLNALPDLVFRLTKEGMFVDYKAAKNFQLLAFQENVIGLNVRDVMPQDIAQKVMQAIARALPSVETQILEYQIVLNDSHKDYEARIVVCGDDEVVAIVRDITERKQAEAALQESQRFVQQIADTTPSIVYIYDLIECRYIYANRSISKILGYSPEQFKQMEKAEFLALFHPDDIKRINEHYQQCLELGEDEIIEIEYQMKDVEEQWHWLCSRDKVFSRLPNGTPQQIIGTATDITSRKQVAQELQQANQKLIHWVNELEQRNQEMTLLGKMSDFLQTCVAVKDAFTNLAALIQPMFLGSSGGVFMFQEDINQFQSVATWGSLLQKKNLFPAQKCWALHYQKSRFIQQIQSQSNCQPINVYPPPIESLCVPMMAEGKAWGLFYLSSSKSGILNEAKQKLAVAVAEHLALAIGNLKLRERLKHESIHDSLTGLFNRRYMEESLKREVVRSRRQRQPFGLIMIDIDYFKQFNDTFGHEAGDRVLREIGHFLQRNIRSSDIACRYGGEEFLLILQDAFLEDTRKRAEQLRAGVKQLQVEYHDQVLDTITISVGVACFPDHGLTGEAVIQAADEVLYQAKRTGRDRVTVAPIAPPSIP
jgi:diguanylate cyclase (GGDEF)-like protein/PAS domain S-box-containing protein